MEGSQLVWFRDCSYKNKHLVGGKCSSLGELHNIAKRIGFSIGDGFALSITLYDDFIANNNLESVINESLESIDIDNIKDLEEKSALLRKKIASAKMSDYYSEMIFDYYRQLSKIYGHNEIEVAVRSSALAEDLPNASFAGQHDTYLNVFGEEQLIQAIKDCFASLFNSRAISYRKSHNIQLDEVKISVAVQKMFHPLYNCEFPNYPDYYYELFQDGFVLYKYYDHYHRLPILHLHQFPCLTSLNTFFLIVINIVRELSFDYWTYYSSNVQILKLVLLLHHHYLNK